MATTSVGYIIRQQPAGGRQRPPRRYPATALPSCPAGQAIFDDFCDRELQPAYLADADANRALLDRRVICDLLGFDAGVYRAVRRLAAKWCADPSVHGGKARPRWAAYAE